MARKKPKGEQFDSKERVVAIRDLPGIPEGTGGKVVFVEGFTWIRYWVRFDNGAASYVEVLVAENDLFTAELNLVTAQADRLTQIVNVYKAMGGGWVDMADALAMPSDTSIKPPAASAAK